MNKFYWYGFISNCELCDAKLENEFIDGKYWTGQWAKQCPKCWDNRKLGLGLGQKYVKQPDGRWLKVQG